MLNRIALLGLVLTFLFIPQVVLGHSVSMVMAMPNKVKSPLVCVLVNSSIYAAIEHSLNQYASDVENSGFSVNIIETNQLPNMTAQGIRFYLQEAILEGLVGCILVGDIPAALFKNPSKEGFPIDLYYMDLDGVWIDLDGDTIYEVHSGDVAPEIWVGRLKAPDAGGDEASMLNNYFNKNHRYRNGLLTLPWWRALLYIDDDWVSWPFMESRVVDQAKFSLGQVYSDIILEKDPVTTNATDYKNRLNDSLGYQSVYIICHGEPSNHTFMIPLASGRTDRLDGTVYASDYRSIDPRAFFLHLYICSAARFTERDYIAGAFIFASTHGLLAIGSTESISIFPYELMLGASFYKSISEGKYVGAALREWFTEIINEYDYPECRFYGLSIMGDPTLKLYHERHDVAVANLTTSLSNATEGETISIAIAAENQGDFRETFNITVYDELVISRLTTKKVPLINTEIVLMPQANKTLIFVFPRDVFKDDLRYHIIWAEASTVPREADTADNIKFVYPGGRVIRRSLPTPYASDVSVVGSILFSIFVFAVMGISGFGFMKILGSEKLPSPKRFLRRYLGAREKEEKT